LVTLAAGYHATRRLRQAIPKLKEKERMADWPMPSDYSAMLQNPRVAFKDPSLQAGSITYEPNSKQPKVCGAGAFAVVYQARLSGQKKAIRAFTTYRNGVQERYQEISKHLATLNLPYLVGFEYLERGIRATVKGRSQFYPLITMDWAAGMPLYEWSAERCLARETRRLRQAADQWKLLIEALAGARMAHGDLQHANILVDDRDQFRLVDYDGMCVPSLIGKPTIECGVAPYQHPQRNANTLLSLSLDNFSAIFIYVALRALAAHPELWDQCVVATKYDKLLFQPEDFKNRSASLVYRRLQSSTDSDLPRLSKVLFDLYHGSIRDVPALKDVLFSYDSVRTLLDQKLFDQAVDLVDRQNAVGNLPQDLVPRVENARKRVNRLVALRARIAAGDERTIKDLYDGSLLDDYPAAAAEVATARFAAKVIPILDCLAQAQRLRQYRTLQQIWDANRSLLEPRKSAQSFRTEVEKWRPANEACATILRLVDQPTCDPDQLRTAMRRLQAGGGHPEIDVQMQQRLDRVLARAVVWQKLQAVLTPSAGISEQADQELVRTWDDLLFAGWDPARGERPKFAAAQQRLQILVQLSQVLVKTSSPTQQTEREICHVVAQLPAGYQFSQIQRGQTAKRRLELAEQALAAAQRQDDLALARHWSDLSALAGQNLLDAAAQARAVFAQNRFVAWSAFRFAADSAAADPGTQSDMALIAQWNESLFAGWPVAEPQRAIVDQARQRQDILRRLGLCSANTAPAALNVEREICELSAHFPPQYQHSYTARVDLARQRIEALQQLQRVVQSGGDEEQILAAWKTVHDTEASNAADPTCRQRVGLAQQRVSLWEQIAAVLKEVDVNPGERAESQLLRLWNDPVLRGWNRAEACRPRLVGAQQNDAILQQLRQAIGKQPTPQGEEEICRLAERLPQKYEYADRLRTSQARQRLDVYTRLTQQLRAGTPEAAIQETAEALAQVQGTVLLDRVAQQRVELARQRTPVIRVLESLPPTMAPEKYDAQILAVWREDILHDCLEAKRWEPRYRLACRRRDLIVRLDAALSLSDEPAIGEIICDRELADYLPYLDSSRPRVADVRRNTQESRELLRTIEKNCRDAFYQRFDVRVLRRCPYIFTSVRPTLVAWTREEILPLERMNLCVVKGRDNITHSTANTYRVRWGLPEPRFAEEFLVGVAPRRLGKQSDPQSLDGKIHLIPISHETYLREGCTLFWSGGEAGFVYVWAVVNLGFCALNSPPLELGPIRAPIKRGSNLDW
jgi:hypothetical protein